MLGDNLKFLRLKHGYSQEYIAKLLGKKSFTTVQKWESGSSDPPLATVGKLADLYQVSIDTLYYSDLQKPKISDSKEKLDFSQKERDLIKKYRALSAPVQKTIDDLIDLQYEAVKPKVEKDKAI